MPAGKGSPTGRLLTICAGWFAG